MKKQTLCVENYQISNLILLNNQFQSVSFASSKFFNNSEILFDEIAYEFLNLPTSN